MNQRQIGFVIILLGVLSGVFVLMTKAADDRRIAEITKELGSCYLSDGTCLHEERDFTVYILGGILSGSMLLFGLYLALFDRTQEILAKHQQEVSSALRDARKFEKGIDEFSAFLVGFQPEEQKVLRLVHEQEGIQQSTLRYKTGMSKATLSILLGSLEERRIIHRKENGKTKKIFLVRKF